MLAANGNYKQRTDYVIVDNDGTDAVTGTFTSVASSFAFLIPTVIYSGGTGNDVVLTLKRNNTVFSDIARTRNQRAVADALDRFPTGNALVSVGPEPNGKWGAPSFRCVVRRAPCDGSRRARR